MSRGEIEGRDAGASENVLVEHQCDACRGAIMNNHWLSRSNISILLNSYVGGNSGSTLVRERKSFFLNLI
jgi:hypothetical protein